MMEQSVFDTLVYFNHLTRLSARGRCIEQKMRFLCVEVRLVTEGKTPSGYTNILSGNRRVAGRRTGCVYQAQERVKIARFCEHGDETWDYTQCGEFLDQVRND